MKSNYTKWTRLFLILSTISTLIAFISFEALQRITPRFDLRIDLNVPAKAGSFEVYLNNNSRYPFHFDYTKPGRQKIRVENLPAELTHLRLNPTDSSNLDIEITEIAVVNSRRFSPAADQIIVNLIGNNFEQWGLTGIKKHEISGKLTTTNNDPTMRRVLNLDLPSIAAATHGQYATVAIIFLVNLVAAIVFCSSALCILFIYKPRPTYNFLSWFLYFLNSGFSLLIKIGRNLDKWKGGFLTNLTDGVRKASMSELDGLRGIAALIVVIGNYSTFSPTIGPLISDAAKHGVWLFFILSSFLLSYLFQSRMETNGFGRELASYFPRRFFRIFPMYYVSLALLFLIPGFAHHMWGGRDLSILDHALLIYPEGVYWSISVEFEFYFFLPLFVIVNNLLKSTVSRLIYQFFLLATALFIGDYLARYVAFPANYPHTFPYFPTFMAGMALGLFYAEVKAKNLNLINANLAFFIAIIGTMGIILTIPGIGGGVAKLVGEEAWYHFIARPFQISFYWAMILFGVLFGPRFIARILSFSWLRFAGIVSYSVYLNHILVMALLSGWLYQIAGFYVTGIITLVAVYALSALTYVLVELPCMKMRPNLFWFKSVSALKS